MPGIALGGLASGLDTEGMISQLMQLEAQPATRWTQQKKVAVVREQALRDVHTRIKNLHNTVKDLKSVGTWIETQTAESSDPNKLGATRTGGAGPGAYNVSVRQLASSDQWSFSYSPPAADTSFKITTSGGSQTVSVAAGSTLDDVVGIINTNSDSQAYAVNVGGRLVLSSRATGTGAALTVDTGDGSAVADARQMRTARNAEYSTDDGATWLTSESNVVKNGIPGVDLALKATGTTTVTVSAPSPDYAGVKAKLKAFVEQYNSTIDFIRSKTSETKVKDAKTDTDRAKGVLFNDSGLNGITSRLRSSVRALGDVGVTTTAAKGTTSSPEALAGKLEYDDAKVSAALAKNPIAARKLIEDAAAGLGPLLEPLTTTGGDFDQRIKSATADQKRFQDQIDTMNKRISAKTDALRAQFSAMENAIAHSHSTSSWLSQQLR